MAGVLYGHSLTLRLRSKLRERHYFLLTRGSRERFFQAVDAEVLEQGDKELVVEGIFREAEKMAWAVAVVRAERDDRDIAILPTASAS